MKMNAEVKAKWLAALRSGEYEQARGTLREQNRYCCLGVLCKVQGMEIGPDGDSIVGFVTSTALNKYTPVWNLVGEPDGRRLASWNDTGKSFNELADWIEANL